MSLPSVDFDRYYTNEELETILHAYAEAFPQLCSVYSIGKSYEGRDIWAVTLSNKETGDPDKKPAMYIDGNIHAGEITGSAVCLYTIHRLLTEYGEDRLITHLMDTRTFYIIPRICVDGAEVYFNTPYTPRSSVRQYFYDENAPGLHLADIDGDGHIVMMRVEDPNGPWKVSRLDERLLVPREPGDLEGPFYRLYSEGYINDYQGAEIKPAPPRFELDLNRNFPVDWEAVNRGSGGPGPYPLSEPETMAVIQFIAERKNIGTAQAYHTWSGCILRPYSAAPDDKLPPEDRLLFEKLGEIGERITGYPMISIYHDLTPRFQHPRGGVLLDFLYREWGIITFSTELWDMPGRAGVKGRHFGNWLFERTEEDEAKIIAWIAENYPEGWVDWHPVDHPQLGRVEVGGIVNKFTFQNPPPGKGFLLDECQRNTEFNLIQAAALPRLAFRDVQVDHVEGNVYRVSAVVQNEGWLPTYISRQGLNKGIPAPTIEIATENARLLDPAKKKIDLGHLDGHSAERSAFTGFRRGLPQQERLVRWLVQAEAGQQASVTLTARSQRAGTVVQQVPLTTA